jgi:dTDP-4-dehydrorhamnose reductase
VALRITLWRLPDGGILSLTLLLGAGGMLGHKLFQTLLAAEFHVEGTIRRSDDTSMAQMTLLHGDAPIRTGVDAMDFSTVAAVLDEARPGVVVNCIGVVKQKPMAENSAVSITVNSLFPHLLDQWCSDNDATLIHFSTDCVFSGETGGYAEDDNSDARDLYGRSKYLGEVSQSSSALTLRTSIIGRELSSFRSLVEWLYSQNGTEISGYTNVMYSGVTTLQASQVIVELLRADMPVRGLYQVAGPWIPKYDLLTEIRDRAGLDITIRRDDSVVLDRTMHGDRFTADTGISIPSWSEMISDMVNDTTPYEGAR